MGHVVSSNRPEAGRAPARNAWGWGPKRSQVMLTKSAATCMLALLFTASAFASTPTSPLADAAEKSDRAAIRALLKQRADVNTTQADGMTALHWAAHHDDREIAEMLVRAGAN